MSVTIRLGLDEATVSGFVWTSKNAPLAELLNLEAALDKWARSPATPNGDLYLAEKAVKVYGGKIVRRDQPEVQDDDLGRIY